MHKRSTQEGSLLLPFILVLVLLLGSIGFGAWAFMGRQDYKNNVDGKIVEAVEVANEKLSAEKEAEFAEREKQPNKTYQGPVTFGTLNITYPKTWSAYVEENAGANRDMAGYFHPNFVPAVESDTSFALKFEVVSKPYDQVVQDFDGFIKGGRAKLSAYRAPKVPDVLGAKVEGEIIAKKQGVMVVLPLRDKTIKLWTEGDSFRADYNAVLDNLTFVP